jgi:hypothetical protein
VSVERADFPDAFSVAFDVIYAGETWCRSVVEIGSALAAHLGYDERAVAGAARDALLDLLVVEVVPVSFHLHLGPARATVLARATPGG